MEERSGRPDKKVKVTSAPNERIKVNVHKGQPTPHAKKEPTFADYVPPAMDDPGIDKAIDDIIVSESNEVLAAEDSMLSASTPRPKKKKQSRLKKIIKSKWLYIGLGAVIIGLFAWPSSRYLILGPFVSHQYKITVVDSVTNTPVSGALLSVGKTTVSTDAYGRAKLKLSVGKHKYTISKHFYATTSGSVFVGLVKAGSDQVHLQATGRQVTITVKNKLSGRLLADVKITVLNTTAITNSSGTASLVLPTKQASYEATISANGFNSFTTPVKVTTSSTANVISLVPAGSVYFLSNATGTIDVIKANLDGSNPTAELSGTGHETTSTKLIASPDNKYLILEAERSGSQPELYVINTANGNLTEFDSSPDVFNIVGWSSDMFIYDEIATSNDTSTTGREQLKSYNALTNQLNVLDQNQVVGSSPSYGYQSFSNFELMPDLVVYTTQWTSVGGYDISTQNDTLRSVEPNGLNKKDYANFQAANTGSMSVVRYQPESLYIAVNNSSTNQTAYYSFMNAGLNTATISPATFSASYPTYFISPSGVNSLWTVAQGTNTQIMTGNQSGLNAKNLLVPSGFSAYGWYDNVYILLTKAGKLYIIPATGSSQPLLIGSYLS